MDRHFPDGLSEPRRLPSRLVPHQFCSGMIESGNATLHVTGRRCLSFSLDGQISAHIDPLVGSHVLKGDSGATDDIDITDRRTVELGHCPAGATQEDVGDGVELVAVIVGSGSVLDFTASGDAGQALMVAVTPCTWMLADAAAWTLSSE